ncbi:MAG: hypothetical protein GX593_06160 [Actinomycetales bacterium]|nr:hypothetical protein [Actinomycetales bacterium]
MTAIDEARARLRERERTAPRLAGAADGGAGALAAGLAEAGVAFAAVGGTLETRWDDAVVDLAHCVRPLVEGDEPVLWEGGPYPGAWIESTATINAELLDRFAPAVTRATHLLLARHQREDGLLPYKVTADGPAFSQIQMVTPLARCVWHHYLLTGRSDLAYLRTMYDAMARHDAWLAAHRDTRGTGAVEAFGTFDTGHDGSPRFWFLPERPLHSDAARFDPLVPRLPLIAPDLTANVACQRDYLARIADELASPTGEQTRTGDGVAGSDGAVPHDGAAWRAAAHRSRAALAEHCWHAGDGTWYDRAAGGDLVRIESDVLLRVLACEIGDDALFTAALERYLMHTRKFLAHYGLTSLALDDPRFEANAARNSWGGPVNFLTLVRAPHAFEQHGHVAELALIAGPVLTALAEADRFPQCLDPWSGEAAYGERYSPGILWFLDAVERTFGILPRPDGAVWFSGLTPTRLDGAARATAVAYARDIDGARFELAGDDEQVVVWRDGAQLASFPRGARLETDRAGEPLAVVGLAAGTVRGTVTTPSGSWPVELEPNARLEITPAGPQPDPAPTPRFIPPHH